MSQEVQLQADVGSLSIRGLGAFTSMLATLSADNVAPMALIQMEKLGTTLPTSGAIAERVKTLLQRCSDVRLERLALIIGWRKNDSASLMAGSAGGQAIALLSMCLTNLFRHGDTGLILALEGVIIQDVAYPKIRCEICSGNADGPIQVQLETSISNTLPVELPITKLGPVPDFVVHHAFYTFKWRGWLADYLQLIFVECGLRCDQLVLEACCDLLVLVPASLYVSSTEDVWRPEHIWDNARVSLVALLGPLPRARMSLICEELLGCGPTGHYMDLRTAFENLIKTVEHIARPLTCDCKAEPCDWSQGWYDKAGMRSSTQSCPRKRLWYAIGDALMSGLWSFWIDPGPNATIRPCNGVNFSADWITRAIKREHRSRESLMNIVFTLFDPRGLDDDTTIMTSSGSCTVYPSVIRDLQLPPQQLVTFSLIEGQIVFENRYHKQLQAARARYRPRAKRGLSKVSSFTPSHIGVHPGNPLLTIREGFDVLELQCSVQYAGAETKIDLSDVIRGYIGLQWTSSCSHRVDEPMDISKYRPLATSVASPAAVTGRLGVAMTRWNPVAQFLCCSWGYQAILQKDCCLNCAAEALGIDSDGIDSDGIDSDGIDSDGMSSDGMDPDGVDLDGVDADDMDADGIDSDGMDADDMDSDGIDSINTDSRRMWLNGIIIVG
ncbi:MAG: hypothetical protein Q9225_000435 [Loekoesia sp. 1 TL-2023]